ncbi:hypothetical protein [Streptomyces sp. Root264]|uniref:hypothetical protein n=1 Tax=Streptomyces sp. Root264 TaxID=1736503 RepID=UPI00070901FA|nr:hypothetical protein [Streptomyces sp. Root264]KRD17943.1 hypothetical protein ASE41_20790 [Streptomyces sp. Root264]
MTSFPPSPSRRLAAAASALTAITVTVGVLVLALGASLPQAWWPRTGQAFASDAATAPANACNRITGPAKTYCERGRRASSAGSDRNGSGAAAWKLLPAATTVGALLVWRRRTPTRQGRP